MPKIKQRFTEHRDKPIEDRETLRKTVFDAANLPSATPNVALAFRKALINSAKK